MTCVPSLVPSTSSESASVEVASPAAAVFVGIDVSKLKLDLAIDGQQHVQCFTNDEKGIAELVALLGKLAPQLIVVEATGGYERLVLRAALDADLPIARVQPGRVRHFAKAHGLLAKTDKIDARVLAMYARCLKPAISIKRTENQEELAALITLRRQLINARTAHNNQMEIAQSAFVRATLAKLLRQINDRIKQLDKKIEKLIDDDEDLSGRRDLLLSVPGVGKTTAATLAAQLPELGQIDRAKIAALVGVAPYNHDSGKHTGKRSIFAGRSAVRCVLYMATITAMRCNSVIKVFAERLRKAGKMPKVVITACMRKLLTILNAIARDEKPWSEKCLAQNT
jgi:transposase